MQKITEVNRNKKLTKLDDDFNEVVVSATRYEEERSSIPASVTIMTEKDIDNSTAHNIPELIRGAGDTSF